MTTVLIVYASSMGNTKRMAEALSMGAQSVDGVSVLLRTPETADIDEVRNCDALVLGSPVRHGNADARLRKFIEDDCESLACGGRLCNKLGAVFTVGANYGRQRDGGELAQLALLRALAGAGMMLVSGSDEGRNPASPGPYWGPHTRLEGHENGLDSLAQGMERLAYAHGKRIARLTLALAGQVVPGMSHTSRWPRIRHFFAGAAR